MSEEMPMSRRYPISEYVPLVWDGTGEPAGSLCERPRDRG
jgi:hypothetical protein